MHSIYKSLTSVMLCTVLAASVIGCSSDKKKDETTQPSSSSVSEVTTKSNISADIDTSSFPKTPGVISSASALSFTSDIDAETNFVKESLEIDKQLQAEVVSGNYSINNPLIVLNPFGNSPLTAVVVFTAPEKCSVKVTVKGTSKAADVTGTVKKATNHRVPIVGLYPDKENKVVIELIGNNKKVIKKKTLKIKTDPLPDVMDDAVKIESHTKTMSYGLIEVSGFGTKNPYAFDENGDIRWYLTGDFASYGYFPLSNNHFMVMDGDVLIQTEEKPHAQKLYEMDYLGRVYQIYFAQNGAHHEIIEKTPGGNLLIASSSVEEYVEDCIEEIDRTTGEVVKRLNMEDVLGKSYKDMTDWAHVNTVSYVESDDTVVISPRNTHSVIKVDWSTLKLKWILSDPTAWEGTEMEKYVLKPTSGDSKMWFYQQHSPYQLDFDLDNNPDTIEVALYDNHWQGTRKIDSFYKEGSSVKIYIINEKKKTVTLDKNFVGIISKITSNYVFNQDAMTVFSMGGRVAHPEDDLNGRMGIIYEFDYKTGNVLNSFSTKNSFYRAYGFEPNLNSCAGPLAEKADYQLGTLDIAVLSDKIHSIPTALLSKDVSLTVDESNVLYVKATDHSVSAVEFINDSSTYVLNLAYTKGGEKYIKLNYKLAVPFQNLTSGTYHIVVTHKGTRYDTGKTIIIK